MRNFYKKFAMVFTTIGLFTFVATSQTTINVKVSDPNDDVEEYRDAYGELPVGGMDHGSSDLELCTQNANNRQMIGIIFRNVAIPKGATITKAYVQFTCDDDDNQEGPLPISIWGIKEANTSAPFTADLFNCTSRPNTTATVTWSCPVWAVKEERGVAQQTPELKTIIQEIVNQAGWASGNNLGVKLTNDELASIHRESEAYEENSGTGAAELFVTYTATVGEDPIRAELPVLLYPNPTKGQLNIKNPSLGEFGYSIYTISGKLVSSRNSIDGSTTEVDMSSFAKGTYLVEIKAAGKTVKEKLILK